jgi:hypothetical protein
MGFINKKAHNVRQDRFNTPQIHKIENKPEVIEAEIVKPMVIEAEIVEVPMIEAEMIESVSEDIMKEKTIPQPKKKKKKTQENNNIETI